MTNEFDGIEIMSGFGNNITRNILEGNNVGMSLVFSSDNSVSANKMTGNTDGVDLWNSSDNKVCENSVATNSRYGIQLSYFSKRNLISGNNVEKNEYGIELDKSSDNILRNNNMSGNKYNFYVCPYSLDIPENIVNDVDPSNKVEGKPVHYLNSLRDIAVPSDAGCVVLVNCSGMSIRNLGITNNWPGILLAFTTNSIITENNVTRNGEGIFLYESPYNIVSENSVANCNLNGIVLFRSSHNIVRGNNIAGNKYRGIELGVASDNQIIGNNISSTSWITLLESTSNTRIFWNNFFGGMVSIWGSDNFNNSWDNGYPSGGNYWSDHTGVDIDVDGIGDTAYTIGTNNTDRYPLMGMFHGFNVSWIEPGYNVELISNSSVSAFDVGFWIEHPEDSNARIIKFNVTGETGTAGFCRVCIPTTLLNATYKVLLNGMEIPCTLLPCSNSTHSCLYFNYTHSTEEVIITPEFPSFLILPLFMIATLLTVIVYKRKHATRLSQFSNF